MVGRGELTEEAWSVIAPVLPVSRGRRGRPLVFDHAVYARRNVVERCINRLKQWRGLATRYAKRAANYRAMVVIASVVLWLDARIAR
jgi:transposase